ncbi:MAG: methionine gamma-lyase family protein [Ruminiclostridium sp.]|nr:methionine gamma-lyase family protein [Ruminiclostridium sp.]
MSCYFNPDKELENIALEAEEDASEAFDRIDHTARCNSEKVLKAFIDNRVGEMHLKGTTGYGYGDDGRDKLDAVFAQVLGAEDALVRHNFVNGTHAISTALFGVLRPGDLMLSLTGTPYDTLNEVIFGKRGGSLTEFGVKYDQIDLLPDGRVNFGKISDLARGCKVAYIQRSRGYSLRPSISVSEISEMIDAVKGVNPDAIIIVDNCYGELVERVEPCDVGADLIVGSLIKNLGGGIAPTGGYIAGRKDLVELCSYRLTTVGTGKEVGCTLDMNRSLFLGLFYAPEVVKNAVKTATFASAFFRKLGFEAFPHYNEYRTDIITAVKLGSRKALIAFCEGIQAGSPVDSFVTPEPWDMPGYDSQVIMAAGAFTMGASIELSADAPLREPFAVWLQGGLTYDTGRMGIILAAQRLLDKGIITLK